MKLQQAQFHILLTLLDGPKHGYAIMKAVEQDSQRQLKLGPATLYTNLKKLLQQGWITELEADGTDERRRSYELSDQGRKVLQDELDALEHTLELARRRKLRLL